MTPLTAATASTASYWPGWLILTAVGVLAPLVYAASCIWWPFARCRLCEGRGIHARKDGKVFRPCWWCKGSGRRLRLGRRVWNYFASKRREAR